MQCKCSSAREPLNCPCTERARAPATDKKENQNDHSQNAAFEGQLNGINGISDFCGAKRLDSRAVA